MAVLECFWWEHSQGTLGAKKQNTIEIQKLCPPIVYNLQGNWTNKQTSQINYELFTRKIHVRAKLSLLYSNDGEKMLT